MNSITGSQRTDLEPLINGKYKLVKKIGAGSFGIVYQGMNITSGDLVAIKIEKAKPKEKVSLANEAYLFLKLQEVKRIPRLYWAGIYEKSYAMVTELMGKDLGSYLKIYNTFSLKTTFMIGIQMLECIEEIHLKGIIHRDIKPENIMIGRGDNKDTLYLVDFGISKAFLDKDGNHISFRENKNFVGTTRFASIAAHEGNEVCRKDDLESLGYVLIYFLKGVLPWQNLHFTDSHKATKVGNMKKIIILEELCKGLPNELLKFMEYQKRLKFKDSPNMIYLKELLFHGLKSLNEEMDNVWDWAAPLKIDVSRSISSNRKSEMVISKLTKAPFRNGPKCNSNLFLSNDNKANFKLHPIQDRDSILQNQWENSKSSIRAHFSSNNSLPKQRLFNSIGWILGLI